MKQTTYKYRIIKKYDVDCVAQLEKVLNEENTDLLLANVVDTDELLIIAWEL